MAASFQKQSLIWYYTAFAVERMLLKKIKIIKPFKFPRAFQTRGPRKNLDALFPSSESRAFTYAQKKHVICRAKSWYYFQFKNHGRYNCWLNSNFLKYFIKFRAIRQRKFTQYMVRGPKSLGTYPANISGLLLERDWPSRHNETRRYYETPGDLADVGFDCFVRQLSHFIMNNHLLISAYDAISLHKFQQALSSCFSHLNNCHVQRLSQSRYFVFNPT
jgi:hypothetical protein